MTASFLVGAIVVSQSGCTSVIPPLYAVPSGKVAAEMLKEHGPLSLPLHDESGDLSKHEHLVVDKQTSDPSPDTGAVLPSDTLSLNDESLAKNRELKGDNAGVDVPKDSISDSSVQESVQAADSRKVGDAAEPAGAKTPQAEPVAAEQTAVVENARVEAAVDERSVNVEVSATAQPSSPPSTERAAGEVASPASELRPACDNSVNIDNLGIRIPEILRREERTFPCENDLQLDERGKVTMEGSQAADPKTTVEPQSRIEAVDATKNFVPPSPEVVAETERSGPANTGILRTRRGDFFNVKVVEVEQAENDESQPNVSEIPAINQRSTPQELAEYEGDFIPPAPVVNADLDKVLPTTSQETPEVVPHIIVAAANDSANGLSLDGERQIVPAGIANQSKPPVLADQAGEESSLAGSDSANADSFDTQGIALAEVNHHRLETAGEDSDIPRMFGLGEDSETITEAGFATHFSDGSFSYYPQSGLDALHDSFSFETVRTDSAGKSARWITMVHITHLLATESQAATSAEHESLQSEPAAEPDVIDDLNSNASKSLAPQATTHGKANAVEKIRVADDKHGVDFSIEQKTLAYPTSAPVLREVNFDLPQGPSFQENVDSPDAQNTEKTGHAPAVSGVRTVLHD